MFDQIQGPDHDRMEEMKKQLAWFYGRLSFSAEGQQSEVEPVPSKGRFGS